MNKCIRPQDLAKPISSKNTVDLMRDLKTSISYRMLEPRMAFDGAAVATAVAVLEQSQPAPVPAEVGPEATADVSHDSSPANDHPIATPSQDDAGHLTADAGPQNADGVGAITELMAAAVPVNGSADQPVRNTIVFIDSNVENIDQIAGCVDPSFEIILIDQNSGGLEQIAGYLEGRTGISSIHIVSHGETGTLYLGSDTISSGSLVDHQAALATIGAALATDGDILLYGCDVANGSGGMDFLRDFSAATGADIAASVDATGGDEAGGDWVLEATKGTIEATALENPLYAGLLVKTNTGAWTVAGLTASNTTDGITTTVTFNSSFSALSGAQTLNNIAAFDNTAQGGASLGAQWNSGAGTVTITFSSAVTNPVVHLDRIGGINGTSNSSLWTLATVGASLTKLTGPAHFEVNAVTGTILRTTGATTAGSESSLTSTTGTAAGSVRVNGTFTTITFNVGQASGPTGADGFELAIAIDAPPVAVTDSFSTVHDTPVTIDVRANDSDIRSDAINVTKVNGTSIIAGGPAVAVTGGAVALNAAGNLVFTPNANYTGSPSFTYTISDANGGSATATVNGIVTNAAPVLDLDASGAGTGWSATYTENSAPISIADLDAVVTDVDDANMESASITLTNPQSGDRLLVNGSTATTGTLPGGITYTISGSTVSLTGSATRADYANAIKAIQFDSTSETPATVPRIINTTVNDGTINSNTAVTAISINLAPDPVNDAFSGSEDNTISGSVLGNDDLGDTAITGVTKATDPVNGSVVVNNDGTFVYTPNGNFNGTDSFTYTLTDKNGDSKTATVTLTVTPVNDAPVNTVPGPRTATEDVPLAITGVSVGEVDSPATVLTTTLTIPAGSGILNITGGSGATISGDGTRTITLTGTAAQINAAVAAITYTPVADYNTGAPATPFNLQVSTSDGSLTDVDNVAITVTPVADIAADTVGTNEDTPVTFAPLGNDNFENGVKTITAVAGLPITAGGSAVAVPNGTVTLDAAGNLTFTPAANTNGASVFSYTVSSGGVTETANITVNVAAVNDAPANTVPAAQFTTEDVTKVITGIAVSDVDGGSLTTTLSIPAGSGTLTVLTGGGATISANGTNSVTISGTAAQINAAVASISYVPVSDYNTGSPALPVNLTMVTSDGSLSDTDTVAITVTPVVDISNDAVSVNEDSNILFNALTGTNGATADSFENAGAAVTSVTQGTNGSVTFAANGAMTYTPNANFNGTDTFSYTVTSGGVTETATVTVTVNSINDAPVNMVPPTQATIEDTSVVFNTANGNQITINDVDTNVSTTLTVANGTLNLGSISGVTVTGNGTGSVTVSGSPAAITAALNGLSFNPTADWNGTTTLNVSTTDGIASPAVSAVTITVAPVVDITANGVSTPEDTTRTFNVLSNDSFENAGALVSSVTQPGNGSVTIGASGNVTYTPNLNFNGTDTFTYTVTSGGVTETTTVTMTVTAVNDAPKGITPLPRSSVDGAAATYNLSGYFSDVDGDVLTFSAAGLPAGLSINATTGQISGTINGHASQSGVGGVYTVAVTAQDPSGATVTRTFSWTVTNPAPVAGNDTFNGNEDVNISGSVLGNDSDPDGDTLSVNTTPVSGPSNGTLTLNSNGTFTYVPNLSFNGTDSFTYQVIDADGATSTATVTLNINPVNDNPVITAPATVTASEDTPFQFTGGNKITVSDIDSTAVTNTLAVTHGTLTLSTFPGVTITGSGTGTLTLSGTPSAVSSAMAAMAYKADADYNGTDTLSISSTDSIGTTAQSVAITVSPVADITADSVSGAEDGTITFNVLAGTGGATADNFEASPVVTGITQPANGSVTFDGAGNMIYTPVANYNGADSFTYTVTSGGVKETTTVTINVTPVNDVPVQKLPGPQAGTEDVNVIFSAAQGNQLVISDIDSASVTTTVSVPSGRLTAITTPGVTITTNGTGSVTLVGSPKNITIALDGLRYTPVADFNGTVSMTVSTNDGSGPVAGTVGITLSPVADIIDDGDATNEDTAVSITVLATDTFENAGRQVSAINGLAITAGGAAVSVANGTVTMNALGILTFTPDANYNGTTNFNYTVTSGGVTETANVVVVVNPTNDPPEQQVPGDQAIDEDTKLVFSDANGNAITVSDIDGEDLVVTLTVTNGTLVLGGDLSGIGYDGDGTGTITIKGPAKSINAALADLVFLPAADYNGPADLLVVTSDGTATVKDIIAIDVKSVVDIEADSIATSEDTPITINVLANDTFENGDAAITGVTQGGNGTVTIGAGGDVTYKPNDNFYGSDSFTYTVTSGGVTETITVSVDVAPVNDPVTVSLPSAQSTIEDTNLVFTGGNAITVADLDGDQITMTLSASNGLITLGSTSGVTVSGDGTGIITVKGSAAALNAALNNTRFAPNADYNGPAVITVSTTDGTATVNGSIDITVSPVVDVTNDTVTTNEDTPISFNVLTGTNGATADSFEAPSRTVTGVTQGASGTVTFLSDGTLVYTPNVDFHGSDSFTYTVTSGGVTETATVTVNISDVNDVPVTTGLPDRTNLDGQTVSISAAASFSDRDTTYTLTYSATGLPAGLSINPTTGVISGVIDSSASVSGPYRVTVTASDGHPGGTVSAAFDWDISNPAPTASDDVATTAEDTVENISVLANDSDPDNDNLTVTAATAGNGTVTIKPDGTIDYTPDSNFNGTDTIVYQISDGEGGFSTATVSVTVTPVNDGPVTTGLGDLVDSDSQNVSIDVTTAFSDIDGDTLTYSVDVVPPGLSFNPVTGKFTGSLAPSASSGGPYVITVTADDGNGATVSTTFTWTVLNIPPTSGDDLATTPEDTPVVISVLSNDYDPDNDPLSITEINGLPISAGGAAVPVAHGSVTMLADSFGNQVLIFTPDADWNGTTSLVYTISDGNGGLDTATLTINVTPANDAPTADPLADMTNNDSDLVNAGVGAFFHDIDIVDGDQLTFTAVSLPPGLSIDANTGLITGTIDPSASQSGPYLVVIKATDSAGKSVTQTFNWTVNNPLPTAIDDSKALAEGVNATVNAASGLLSNDTDPDNDPLTVGAINGVATSVGTPIAGSAGGLFTINADGSYTFDQNGAFEDLQSTEDRVTTITYTVSDGNGGIATATLSITISGTNDSPAATAIANQPAIDNTPFSLTTASAFTDVDGDTLTFSVTGLPAGLVFNPATGAISGMIDPSASQGGTGGVYTVTVTANDGNGGLTPVIFTISATNPAPVALGDIQSVVEDTPVTGNVLTNDSDPDGDVRSVTGFNVPGVGAFPAGSTAIIPGVGQISISTTGAYTFTPDADYNGPVPVITYTMTDNEGGTDTATLTLGPVTAVNDAPASTAIATQSSSDSDPISLNVSTNFSDVDGDPMKFSATGLPPGLSIDPNTGLVSGTIDHLASGSGPYTVVVTATDPNGNLTQQTFNWVVSNPAPGSLTLPDASASDRDPVNMPVGSTFNDPDGDTLTFSASGLPAGLSIDPTTGLITGTLGSSASQGGPSADGVYTINVTATDSQGLAVTQPFTYSVTNPVPTASNDEFSGLEDMPINGAVGGNDQDPDGDAVTYGVVTGPAHGTLVFNTDGTFTYTPNANYNATDGRDSFTYQIIDADGNTATATVTLTVGPVNDPPVAVNVVTTTLEDTPISGSLTATDVDGDILSFGKVSEPIHGTVVLDMDGNYTYTPDPNFHGTDSFTYVVTDGNGGSVTRTVTINVTTDNDPPVATNDVRSFKEDTAVSGTVLQNDTDVDLDPLTVADFTIAGDPTIYAPGDTAVISGVGTLKINGDGTYTFTPELNYSGPVPVATYTVTDGQGGTDTATLTLQLDPVNDPPVAVDDPVAVFEDTPVAGNVLSNDTDADGDPLSVTQFTIAGDATVYVAGDTATIPGVGILTIGANGNFTFSPAPDYFGPVPVATYTMTDGEFTDAGTLTLGPVQSVNDSPVAIDDDFTGSEDTIFSGDLTPNTVGQDSDVDGDVIEVFDVDGVSSNGIQPVTGPAHGTLVLNANGTFSYTPDANYNGTDSFTYRISDGHGGFAEATVNLTINPVNDKPVGAPDSLVTPEDQPFTGTLPVATDADGDTITHTKGSDPLHGTVTVNANGTYVYTPNSNYTGADSFTYTVSDGHGGTNTYTVTVMVTPIQDAPTIDPVKPPVSKDGDRISFDVSQFANDVDGDNLTFTATGLPPGLHIDPSTGLITGELTPGASQGGPYSVTLTVDDGHGGTKTVTFTWPVKNPAPIATHDEGSVKTGGSVIVNVLGNDKDTDGDKLIVTKAAAGHGTVKIGADGSIKYTPKPGFVGIDTIRYVISDGNGGFAIATVTIVVSDLDSTPKDVVFGAGGPGSTTDGQSPGTRPFTHESISVEGAVVDAVFGVGELHSVAAALGADGVVLAAANGPRSLGGLGSIGTDNVIVETIRAERSREILEAAGFSRPSQDYKLISLPGFSLRRDVPGNIGGLSTQEQVIVESLVREGALIIQISNSLIDGDKQIVDYRITQADGTPLPGWLDKPARDLLIGRRAADSDLLRLRIEAIYSDGSTVVEVVKIDTATGEIQSIKDGKQGSIAPPLFKDQFRSRAALTPAEIELLGLALAG